MAEMIEKSTRLRIRLDQKGCRRAVALACVFVPLLSACSKETRSTASGPTASIELPSTLGSAAPKGSVGPSAEGSAASTKTGSPGAAKSSSMKWKGTYTAAAATFENPVKSKGGKDSAEADPGSSAVGAGTLELLVDGKLVRGRADGPLGPLALSGVLDTDQLRVQAVAPDPNAPEAMTGWMLLRAESSSTAPNVMIGVLRVAGRDARIVREASVRLVREQG